MPRVSIIQSTIERIYDCTTCGAVTVGEETCCDEAVKEETGYMEAYSASPVEPLEIGCD